jgi:protein phosphatase
MFDGSLEQISEDHTLTMQKVKMGVLTLEQAQRDRDRHKLTRYLGIFEDEMTLEADSLTLPPLPAAEHRRLLLCSDGLTDMLPDERIAEILLAATINDAADLLVEEALTAGGKDNVTCIIIDVGPIEPSVKTSITTTETELAPAPKLNKIAGLFSGLTQRIRKK